MAGIQLELVRKEYTGFTAVDDVSLEIENGEFLVLVGPSGCGNSTLLRIVARLDPVAGRIGRGAPAAPPPPAPPARLRHPRTGRGDDARPARRRDASRPDPAGRHAEAALPRAARHLRRRRHRRARYEPGPGEDRGRHR